MMTYTNHGRTWSAKRNSCRKPKLSERDHHTLNRIVSINHSRWQQNSMFILKTVSTKTVWQALHKSNIHGRAAIAEPVITENCTKRWKRWFDDHKTWPSDVWKYVIWYDVHPSHCSQHLAWFMCGYHPRKPIILHAWFQLWNMEPDSMMILLVLYLLWMVKLLPVTHGHFR